MYPPWLRIRSAYVAVFGARCEALLLSVCILLYVTYRAATFRRFRGIFDNRSPFGPSFDEMPIEYFSQNLP